MVKRPLFILAVIVCALAPATPANASLLGGVLPGLIGTSDTPATCDTKTSQPFARWGDTRNYVLVPGGSFESGTAGWKLNGGAKVVSGNEPFYVRSTTDRYSLYLPPGSSVTTPPMCFGLGNWNARFFSAGSGTVRVKVVVKSLLGILSVLDGGTASSAASWRPSPQVGLLLTNITGLLAVDSISLRFTPANTSGIRIDDVYLDPWKVG